MCVSRRVLLLTGLGRAASARAEEPKTTQPTGDGGISVARLFFLHGRYGEADAVLRIQREDSQPRTRSQALLGLAELAVERHAYQGLSSLQAAQALAEAQKSLAALQDPALLADWHGLQAQHLYWRFARQEPADLASARQHAEQAAAWRTEQKQQHGMLLSALQTGTLAEAQGRFGEADAHYEEARFLAANRRDARMLAEVARRLASRTWTQGDTLAAKENLEWGLFQAQKADWRVGAAVAWATLGQFALQQEGDAAKAVSLFAKAQTLHDETGTLPAWQPTPLLCSQAFSAQGRHAEAYRQAELARQWATRLHDEGLRLSALQRLGDLLLARGDATAAVDAFDQAAGLAQFLERPDDRQAAYSRLSLARALAGQSEPALQTAALASHDGRSLLAQAIAQGTPVSAALRQLEQEQAWDEALLGALQWARNSIANRQLMTAQIALERAQLYIRCTAHWERLPEVQQLAASAHLRLRPVQGPLAEKPPVARMLL